MMKRLATLTRILAVILALIGAHGIAHSQLITRKDSAALARRAEMAKECVIVGNDTVSVILPERNYGRYDRGLYNHLFVPKGKWAFGLTASYGELNTDDVQMLSMIKDLDLSGKLYSVNPTISYFFRHNQSIGLKLTYSRGKADLDNMAFDFDEDLNFELSNVSYQTETYATGLFYRNYVGLGKERRFGVFNEVDLMFQSGTSRFQRQYNGQPKLTRTNVTQASLDFCPGVAIFIQENVAFNVSFGIFGLKLRSEKQFTDGVYDGNRFTSGANFRFNIFNINFGMLIVI